MPRGKYIVLEGIEGSGKGAQAKRLTAWLSNFGEVINVREPGETPTGQKIREILLDQESDLDAAEELLLFFADRSMTMRKAVTPALEAGTHVVADRSYLSTFAYQICGRQKDNLTPVFEDLLARTAHKIDLAIVLDLPAELGLERASKRALQIGLGLDRIEQEQFGFHERVRKGYLSGAKGWASSSYVIDASPEEQLVWEQVKLTIKRYLFSE